MALINCRECGHKMSDRAESCPHCGCPQHIPEETPQLPENQQTEEAYAAPAKKQGGLKWLWAVIPTFLVIAGAFYYFMFVYTPPTAAPKYLSPDYALYNLYGKVKDARVYEETDSGINEVSTIQFDSNGHFTPDNGMFIRNDKGKIIKIKIGDQNGPVYSDVNWENGRLSGYRTPLILSTFEYNLDGSMKAETERYLKDYNILYAGDEIIHTFYDYKFDEHGNWISRTRQVEYILTNGKTYKPDPIHQNRRITYYP